MALQLLDDRYNDIKLTFKEEGHTYTDSLKNKYLSTTTFLHRYKKEFNRKYWLKKKSKELGISETILAKQWQDITDEACDRGTQTHDGLENGIRKNSMFKSAIQYKAGLNGQMVTVADLPNINCNVQPLELKQFIDNTENKYPKIYEVFKYYINKGYKIYAELGTFLIDFLISGMIDVLLVRDDRFVIGDWKTNRGGLQFESGYYKKDNCMKPVQTTNIWVPKRDKLLPPLNHLPECNGYIYNLQLSLYAYTVEKILGIPCAGLWLCHIDSDFVLNQYGMPKRFPDGLYHIKDNPVETCSMFKMKYLKNEIISILNDRQREIRATKITSKTLFD